MTIEEKHRSRWGLAKLGDFAVNVDGQGSFPTPVRLAVSLREDSQGWIEVTSVGMEHSLPPASTDARPYVEQRRAGRVLDAGAKAEVPIAHTRLVDILARHNALVDMVHELRLQLEAVAAADRSKPYAYGELRADDKAAPPGARWLAPKELVTALLLDPRFSPSNL